MTSRSFKGRLLVATPALGDPNFDRAVVLVLEHTDDGALGVVLNRPSDLELARPLPNWGPQAARPPVLFVGGPVSQGAAIALGRVGPGREGEGWMEVINGLGTVDLSRDPGELAPQVGEIRVFSGYAGWSAGQLEEEVEAGAWFVVGAVADDALSPDPAHLWRAVLRRQRNKLALFALFPDDPSQN